MHDKCIIWYVARISKQTATTCTSCNVVQTNNGGRRTSPIHNNIRKQKWKKNSPLSLTCGRTATIILLSHLLYFQYDCYSYIREDKCTRYVYSSHFEPCVARIISLWRINRDTLTFTCKKTQRKHDLAPMCLNGSTYQLNPPQVYTPINGTHFKARTTSSITTKKL